VSKVLRAKSNIKNFLKKFANKSNNDVQCEVKLQFCELKIVMQPAGEPINSSARVSVCFVV